jgi:hypothetical protein
VLIDEEARIYLRLDKTKREERSLEMIEPDAWSLAKSIDVVVKRCSMRKIS